LAALFDQKAIPVAISTGVFKYPRGSKLRRPKPRTSPSDLADRFFELQQLRKKVQKLEKLANSRQGGGGTGIVGRDK
jgi:hypothetical protein